MDSFVFATSEDWIQPQRWLTHFAYQEGMKANTCLFVRAIAFAVTLFTVSRHNYRTATRYTACIANDSRQGDQSKT